MRPEGGQANLGGGEVFTRGAEPLGLCSCHRRQRKTKGIGRSERIMVNSK